MARPAILVLDIVGMPRKMVTEETEQPLPSFDSEETKRFCRDGARKKTIWHTLSFSFLEPLLPAADTCRDHPTTHCHPEADRLRDPAVHKHPREEAPAIGNSGHAPEALPGADMGGVAGHS